MKRKWLFFGISFLIVILLLLFVACNKNGDENDDWSIPQEESEVILKVALFDSLDSIYYYSLTQNGVLEAYLGVISGDYIWGDDLVNLLDEIKKHDTKQLTKAELEDLLEIADIISGHPEWESKASYGAFDVLLYYEDTFYNLTYGRSLSQVADRLVEQLYMLLPIQGNKLDQLPPWL